MQPNSTSESRKVAAQRDKKTKKATNRQGVRKETFAPSLARGWMQRHDEHRRGG